MDSHWSKKENEVRFKKVNGRTRKKGKGMVGQLLGGPERRRRKKKSNTATPCSLQVSYKMERAKDKQLM